MRLEGKVAIVTGAGRGIGYAYAERFVREGAQVVIAGRNAARLSAVAEELGAAAITVDVADEASVAALYERIDAGPGGPDILVNNAGITGPVARAADLDVAAWDETMAINVRGTLLCIKHAVPRMRARGGGTLWSVPYPQELNDIPMIVARQMDGKDFAQMIVDQFDEMLALTQRDDDAPSLVMGLALHPYLVGQPYRLRHLRRALQHVASHAGRELWITTPGAIVDAVAGPAA